MKKTWDLEKILKKTRAIREMGKITGSVMIKGKNQ